MSSSKPIRTLLTVATALALGTALPVGARTLRVGNDAGCGYRSLAAAISAAKQLAGPDTILVTQGTANQAQELTITAQDLTIAGGYTSCSDVETGLDKTWISGYGGNRNPVFTIRGPGVVRLENLYITAGDSTGDGGGIDYVGSGTAGSVNTLMLARTTVADNDADGAGGGIHFAGTGSAAADLVLEQDTGIFDNYALGDGGGIALRGNARLAGEAHRLFFHRNVSLGGSGGAIHVRQPARADIGSATWEQHATFSDNLALLSGGAVAVDATNGNGLGSSVRLYSLLPDLPMRFARNRADVGGTFSAKGVADALGNTASICTRGIDIVGSQARNGGAISVAHADYGDCGTFPPAAIARCAPNVPCGQIVDSASDQPVISIFGGSHVSLRDVRMDRNSTKSWLIQLARYDGRLPSLALHNATITRTAFTETGAPRSLVLAAGGAPVEVHHSTTSGNGLAGMRVFDFYDEGLGSLLLDHAVIDEPGALAFDAAESVVVNYAMVTPHAGLDLARHPTLAAGSPALAPCTAGVVPCRPQPQRSSPVVDFAPYTAAAPFDLDGAARPRDLGDVANRYGPTDLGAFELQ